VVPAVNEPQDGAGFLVAQPLEQHGFVRFDLARNAAIRMP